MGSSSAVIAAVRGLLALVVAAAGSSGGATEPAGSATAMELEVEPADGLARTAGPPVSSDGTSDGTSAGTSAGTVFVHGGGPLPVGMMDRFADRCGPEATLLLIPTAAGDKADRRAYRRRIAAMWSRRGDIARVRVLHTRSRRRANTPSFASRVRAADCVWIGGGAQLHLQRAYAGTRVEAELHALLARGGVIGGYSAGAASLSRVMIRRGFPEPIEGHGLGLLEGVVIDQHFVAAGREPRLQAMVERHPELVGLGVDEGTAMVVTGRHFEVVGRSVVRWCEAGEACRTLEPGSKGRFPGVLGLGEARP